VIDAVSGFAGERYKMRKKRIFKMAPLIITSSASGRIQDHSAFLDRIVVFAIVRADHSKATLVCEEL